jgi:ParB family chromosome partitioning protein
MANGLGRGLGSLIPQKPASDTKQEHSDLESEKISEEKKVSDSLQSSDVNIASSDKDKVLQVPVDKIDVNPMQPRQHFSDHAIDELVESIKKYGVIQPLVASRKGDRFELIAGERRLRSSKKAGLETVPVIVRDLEEQEKLEIALIENVQRENLNPIETAIAYKRLCDEFNLTQEEVAKQIGKSRSSVTNTLRLLNLPEEIRLALIDDKITEGHAKYLVGLESEARQMALFRKILHNNLSVRETSKESRRMGGTKAARIKINYEDKDKEFALREFFGTKAEIKRKGKGGKIIIDFYSNDELGEIMKKIKK